MRTAYSRVLSLHTAGRTDEAMRACLRLWEDSYQYDVTGRAVRRSFLVACMASLVHDNHRLHTMVREFRSSLAPVAIKLPSTEEKLIDWMVLSSALGEYALIWEARHSILQYPGLTRRGRNLLARAALLYNDSQTAALACSDPLDVLAEIMQHRPYGMVHEQGPPSPVAEAALLYASLLIAGRESDASNVAAEAQRRAAADIVQVRVAFVEAAVRANQVRAEHWDWLWSIRDQPRVDTLLRHLAVKLKGGDGDAAGASATSAT